MTLPKSAWRLGLSCVGEGNVRVPALNCGPRLLGIALAAIVLSIAGSSPLRAANWFEKNFYLNGPRYDADLPACG